VVANSNWCVVEDKINFYDWTPYFAYYGYGHWSLSWGKWTLAFSKEMMEKRK